MKENYKREEIEKEIREDFNLLLHNIPDRDVEIAYQEYIDEGIDIFINEVLHIEYENDSDPIYVFYYNLVKNILDEIKKEL